MSGKDTWVSSSVAGMSLSAIKEMAMRSARIEGAASLTWGLPSFRTPAYIRQAVARELEADPDIGKYALPDGLPELRDLVAAERSAIGPEVDADENVLITAGNMQGMNAILHVLIDPGDEIIVTDPGFASHFQQIRLCGGKPVFWRLDEAADWRLDLGALPGLIGEKTKAIILVTPSNPTGKIFSEAELRRVGEVACDANILIILDDPYRHFLYENRARFFDLATVADYADHIAYLFTFSKTYAMSGWRLGYAVVPGFLKHQMLKVHDATLICTPRISQVAGIAALSGEAEHLAEFERILGERQKLICERLDEVPHVFSYSRPEGAYYVFPRITAAHTTSHDFAIRLLEEARVTVTPGSAFGPSGEHHVRMAYCVEEETIERAFDRIEAYFPQ